MTARSALRLRRLFSAVPAILVVGALTLPVASARPTAPASHGPDTESYAADYGTTPEQANAELTMIEEFGDAVAKISATEPGTFAGAYVSHDPFELRVFMTDAVAAAAAAAVVEQLAVEGATGITVRTPSMQELLSAGTDTLAVAERHDASVDVWIDERAGVVVIEATADTMPLVRTLVDDPAIRLVEVEALGKAGASIYGGLSGSGCTTGFSVQQLYASTRGFVTAGHCTNTQTVSGTTQAMVTQVTYGPNDSQWNRRSGDSYPNTIFDGSSTRSITSTKSRDSILVGAYVCHYGRTSGYNCGEVQTKTQSGFSGVVTSPTLTYIRVRDVSSPYKTLGESGDSGGPWFLNSQAWGVHHGGSGPNPHGVNDGVFMSVSYLANNNVYVRTSP